MNVNDLYHWQDTVEDKKKVDEAFAKIQAAGLLDELFYLVDKKRSDAIADESFDNQEI